MTVVPLTVIALVVTSGWGLAVVLWVALARLRRRLERVARAEHELRGPAAVLLLACERMRREPGARRHARALEVELERLRSALSELTAARTGRRAGLRRAPVELGDFAGAAAAGWSGALVPPGRDLRVDWRAGRVALHTDRGRLASVLGNLVANAAEHGDGPVEVRGRRTAGGVRVEVRNGLGEERVAAPASEHRPAPRADERRAPAGDGRGLGLRIAHDAACDLGGRLSVKTEAGTVTAALELPVADGDGFEPVADGDCVERGADGDGLEPVADGDGFEPGAEAEDFEPPRAA